MESNNWKDRLAREVFDWQCLALEVKDEKPSYLDSKKWPDPEFNRSVGWQEAIRIVCTAFTTKGIVGTCLTLAADMDGAVGTSMSLTDNGMVDTTEEFFHTVKPDVQLKEIQAQLRKSLWQYQSQMKPEQWFHGAVGAIECAISSLDRIIQDECIHEPRNDYPSFGHSEPEAYIPGYYYYICKKCRAEVPAVIEIGEGQEIIDPDYTGEYYD